MSKYFIGGCVVVMMLFTVTAWAGHIIMFRNSNGIVSGPNPQCVMVRGEMCVINDNKQTSDSDYTECVEFCRVNKTY